MRTSSSMHPRRTTPTWLLASVAFAAIVLAPLAGAGTECEVLGEEVAFVDTEGMPVDVGNGDAMAFRHVDTTVTVYERTPAAAAALVTDLEAEGETDATLLDPNTWLLAQAATCKMRAGSKCTGVCPGKQNCKRLKKPGKDICQCMLR